LGGLGLAAGDDGEGLLFEAGLLCFLLGFLTHFLSFIIVYDSQKFFTSQVVALQSNTRYSKKAREK
jgi:hypothetical protein